MLKLLSFRATAVSAFYLGARDGDFRSLIGGDQNFATAHPYPQLVKARISIT